MLTTTEFIDRANSYSKTGKPFLFLIDYELQQPQLWLPDRVDSNELLFYINGFTNAKGINKIGLLKFELHPFDREEYRNRFNTVLHHLNYGNTFLTNLTVKSQVEINTTLRELFFKVHAPYRCWLRNQFLFFSPESFIKINNGKIFSFPMKGTIDATTPHAAAIILNDEKEKAEHVTIVDLLRNDLARVASHVAVNRLRYIDEIKTNRNVILQVSSEISGDLLPIYKNRIGSLLLELLPAGSISGAPKEKTTEVIRAAEQEPRGYYTGIFGYFDGKNLDSCVNIRFMEQRGETIFYRSGGGITARSNWEREYAEVIQKIYVPVA
ncbi:MAG: aminodeoxychorismate synthase component I [Cyclobacteriaceae bacterium]|nr:aminodeoxychorismate synthase component I [Cyclobacteriaceae bacterium]